MEGLEDNTIKQTNSCYNKSKKEKSNYNSNSNPLCCRSNRLCNNKSGNNA